MPLDRVCILENLRRIPAQQLEVSFKQRGQVIQPSVEVRTEITPQGLQAGRQHRAHLSQGGRIVAQLLQLALERGQVLRQMLLVLRQFVQAGAGAFEQQQRKGAPGSGIVLQVVVEMHQHLPEQVPPHMPFKLWPYAAQIRPIGLIEDWRQAVVKEQLRQFIERLRLAIGSLHRRQQVGQQQLWHLFDIAVVCGPPQFTDNVRDTIINPIVIIEVLSVSTERYDRGMKFQHYRTIETLDDYMLVAQDHPHIEHFSRQENGLWIFQEATNVALRINIPSIGCVLHLQDVYAQVEFEQENTAITREIPSDE